MAPKKKIPDGWLDYRPILDVIPDAKMIPFKTPLNPEKFMQPSMEPHRWTTFDVIEYLPKIGWELGLIVDLTNKFPAYYNPDDFNKNGVPFEKIACVGQSEPNETDCDKFFGVVSCFLDQNRGNNRVIGIHCTHGINRTGYMLCRYLIQKLGYQPDHAIQCFAEKRGYPIERENYIQALRNLKPLI